VIFLFLVLIVMLNLLIAIMSDSFEKVMENWVVEVRTTNETKSAVREKP
jgi:GTPase SAR1 family protein